jgi:5-methylcytosine-specific restriction endonuclease McrA
MKNQKPDAERVWKQFEDILVPRLALSVVDRAVYSHLLRHSRLEGRRQLRFSIAWLARGARLSGGPTRRAVRRLVERGVLRLTRRSNAGHTVEVRLPEEIRAAQDSGARQRGDADAGDAKLEAADFLRNKAVRQAIHARERGLCFYCLRRVEEQEEKTLDHVVPQAEGGGNSYRNLVSCCADCNCSKARQPASDFLRHLYREGTLTAMELNERIRALGALAAGKLRPRMETSDGADSEWEAEKRGASLGRCKSRGGLSRGT